MLSVTASLHPDFQMRILSLFYALLVCLLYAQASPISYAGNDNKEQLLFQLLKGNEYLRSSIHCEEPYHNTIQAQDTSNHSRIENTLVLSDAEIPISSARVLDLNLRNNLFIQSYGLQILDQAPRIFEERPIQAIILLTHTNSKNAKMACINAQQHRPNIHTPNDLWPSAYEKLEKQQQKFINCQHSEDIDSLSEVHLQTTVEALKRLATAVPPKNNITVISMIFDVTTGEVRLLDLETIPSASSIQLTATNSNEKRTQDLLPTPTETQVDLERNAYHAKLNSSTHQHFEKTIHNEVIPQPSNNALSETPPPKSEQSAPYTPPVTSAPPSTSTSHQPTTVPYTAPFHTHNSPHSDVAQEEEHTIAHEH